MNVKRYTYTYILLSAYFRLSTTHNCDFSKDMFVISVVKKKEKKNIVREKPVSLTSSYNTKPKSMINSYVYKTTR